jgi:hypothetical protein
MGNKAGGIRPDFPPVTGESLFLNLLTDDTIQAIATMLRPEDMCRLARSCRKLLQLLNDREYLTLYSNRFEVTIPPDCSNILMFIYSSINSCFNPDKLHPHLQLSSDRRVASHVTDETRGGYFCAAMGLQEIPFKGSHRYNFRFSSNSGHAPTGQWGAVAVAGVGYNIQSDHVRAMGFSFVSW